MKTNAFYQKIVEKQKTDHILLVGDQSEIQTKYKRRCFPAERHYMLAHNPASSADFLL